MFTGIIREIGIVEDIRPRGSVRRLSIKTDILSEATRIGDSISVDGVCLTVTDRPSGLLSFDLMEETLGKTALGYVARGRKVNLEPSLRLKDGLGGHLVTGHIDEIGSIRKIVRYGEGVMELTISAGERAHSLLVQKGSVAVDGISLTVNTIGRGFFIVDIIPHTFKSTTMASKRVGDRVNIEFDIIGKYVLKNLSKTKEKVIDEGLLKEEGWG